MASGQRQSENFPSMLVFGPQGELSDEALTSLRSLLVSDERLSRLRLAVLDLPKFWSKLASFDPRLEEISEGPLLSKLGGWLTDGVPCQHLWSESPMPFILSFPLNFLFQIARYFCLLRSMGEGDGHRFMLEKLEDGGVQGFCVGFLSAMTVSLSRNVTELCDMAIRALHLAVCIGAYVDQDAARWRFSCISVRGDRDKLSEIIQTVPKAYISAVTDEASMTVTSHCKRLPKLKRTLTGAGFIIHPVPVCGRLHSSVYATTVDRLVELFEGNADLCFPGPSQLLLPVRSATVGTIIREGSLVRHALENTLSKPIQWYDTIKLAAESLPPGHKCVTLAGISTPFPSSLAAEADIRLISLQDLTESLSRATPSQDVGSTDSQCTPPHPTPGSTDQSGFLSLQDGFRTRSDTASDGSLSRFPSHSVAVVGMAGRFPGANSVDELWDLISSGRSTVASAPRRVGLDELSEDVSQVKWWGNFLDEHDTFDHKFFNKSAREAAACDPQQRKLLEVVYEALESAGHLGAEARSDPTDYGCYIGAVMNNYATNVSCHPPTAYATTGTGRAFLSGAVSHHFGWTGPAMTIDTACSSSLVAIHTACRAIASGECSRAIAGGSNIITCPHDYRDLKAAGFLSPTGQCKPFDADADGYCRGEAVAVLVLKSLSAAIEENDDILGVIVGSATSQNPKEGPIVVPNSKAQSDLLNKVMDMSGVHPQDVTYVEAHGTGTGVGDPIEVQSLRDAFGGPSRTSKLHFASIKGNIGHAEAASGAAGLVKAVLMMRHGQIPPQASYRALNPTIPALAPDGLAIPQHLTPWSPPERISCVNNYGAAGSNSVVMIREAPVPEVDIMTPTSTATQRSNSTVTSTTKWPLFLAASNKDSLSLYAQKMVDWVRQMRTERPADVLLSDLLFHVAHRANPALDNIVSTSVSDMAHLESVLSSVATGGGEITTMPSPRPVVLVFGGQEGRFVGLSEAVFKSSHILRRHLDSCQHLALGLGAGNIYPAIFQQTPISNLATLHAALFAVQYSCAKAWMDCGLQVEAVIGHSFGQMTALCISGALSLPDALKLVIGRASLVEKHWGPESGSMLAVQADRRQVSDLLLLLTSTGGYAEIACFNGPRNHVIVGDLETIERVETWNNGGEPYRSQRLEVTHGFHSRFTESLLPQLSTLARDLEWRNPTIHLEVCSEMQSDRPPDHHIVVEHTRHPVYFQRAVERLMKKYHRATWLEAGRGLSVTQLVRACAENPGQHSFLAPRLTATSAQDSLVDTTVKLWNEGHAVQYWPFHRSQRSHYRYLSLPPYQFQKTRHWLPFIGSTASAETKATTKTEDLLVSLITGDKSNEAVFRISPGSERFQALCVGHVMCGHAVMPASAYLEVTSRAALILQEDLNSSAWVPSVQDLAMQSPIELCLDQELPSITMTLRRLDNPWPSWSFSIATDPKSSQASSAPQVTTTGSVHLHKRTDSQVSLEMRRIDTLIGGRRWEQITNDPEAEAMHGKHIYRAFSQVVEYSDAFKGIKAIACVGNEAAGTVKIAFNSQDPSGHCIMDSPMVDSFMQFGGFLGNYFNETVLSESLFVCHHIQRVQVGPDFSPGAKEWLVLANMTSVDQDNVSVDVYVSEAQTKKTVLTALGMEFVRMSRASLARMLSGPGRDPQAVSVASSVEKGHVVKNPRTTPAGKGTSTTTSSKRADIFRIAASIADVPETDLTGETCLPDIGVDSLGATEMVSDIASTLSVTIDLATFLMLPDINAIVSHVDNALGLQPGPNDDTAESSLPNTSTDLTVTEPKGMAPPKHSGVFKSSASSLPTITSIQKSFGDVRLSFDQLGAEANALDYWSEVHPDDVRLVLAYTSEAFKALGCDLPSLRCGDAVPDIKGVLPRHLQLVQRLYSFLKEEGIIENSVGGCFLRTSKTIDTMAGETVFSQTIDKHPLNAPIRQLLHAVGPHLAPCLAGDQDVLQILFGNRANKKWLEDVYREWPMLVTATRLLGNFLCKAFSESSGSGPFRILEVGAGTGGTTRHIVDLLMSRGIPFEYHFTDLSSSLVQKAKSSFSDVDGMSFGVLDIEKEPADEFKEAFHFIISTNCIHATKDITHSLGNLRKMLRDDGAVALIEMTPTRQLYVFDVIVGLLEGWWLFNDGRDHALANVERWAQAFKNADFPEVLWSDGASLEAQTVRVICGFRQPGVTQHQQETNKGVRSTSFSIQEEVYKTVGALKVHADIYCPTTANPKKKMPIALMIHGGSHVLFSRKDVRPPQTRIMLEMGLLPVSLDHRLCPEIPLFDGPMADVCDALEWARMKLPYIKLKNPDIRPDPDNVVVVGWSSGGQLALSTGWTAPYRRVLRPPNAILGFYCPTDYEDEWWKTPIQPIGAEDKGEEYDIWEGVEDEPITHYDAIHAWEPLSDPRILSDPRARIVLHMNWKAQTLPLIINGLPTKSGIDQDELRGSKSYWHKLSRPAAYDVQRCSLLAQVREGKYATPTLLVHGTDDDLIPYQQSFRTVEEMKLKGIDAQLIVVPGGPHVCDTSHDPESAGWQAVLEAYRWLGKYAFASSTE